MPISQNPKETGWFYHAPAKKRVGVDRVDYPAPSNIPGIGFDDPSAQQPEEVREMMFRDTDSDYIRLAKMGGRKDLLAFTPDKYRSKQKDARGYQRNEWFYLEDNRIEDEEKKAEEDREWQFMLPEYMVHKTYKPSFNEPGSTPTRSTAPFYTEAHPAVQDRQSATDKTVKIPEVRRPGYGVRNEKPPPVTQKLPPREKVIKPQDENARKVKTQMNIPNEKEDPTNMTKLLSGDYEKEWYEKRAALEICHSKPPSKPSSRDKYKEGGQDGSGMIHKGNGTTQRAATQEEKEMFKMQRFKNIPSKIDSHQRPEIMASVK